MAYMMEEELEIMSLSWFKEIGYSCVASFTLIKNIISLMASLERFKPVGNLLVDAIKLISVTA